MPAAMGHCQFCGGVYSRRGIKRHLDACPARDLVAEGSEEFFAVSVEGTRRSQYWLYLEVLGTADLGALDRFLRAIWLECCDHMSLFTVNGVHYVATAFGGSVPGEETMAVAFAGIAAESSKFTYQYDMGSTTSLTLRVISSRSGSSEGQKQVQLLARNEEPIVPCASCGKQAEFVVGGGFWPAESGLCHTCADQPKYLELWLVRIANSPRTGICAYGG